MQVHGSAGFRILGGGGLCGDNLWGFVRGQAIGTLCEVKLWGPYMKSGCSSGGSGEVGGFNPLKVVFLLVSI